MEGWLIILGIALVRGLGAYLKRRNARLEKSAPPSSQSKDPLPTTRQPGPSPVPEPFPLEDEEAFEDEGWVLPWESQPQPPPPQPQPMRQAPPPAPVQGVGYGFEAAGARRDLEDRQRQELLQRLATATPATPATPVATAPRGLDVDHAARPQASAAARIHHGKHLADELLRVLRSPDGVRHAMLVREILGPPVSRRGPQR